MENGLCVKALSHRNSIDSNRIRVVDVISEAFDSSTNNLFSLSDGKLLAAFRALSFRNETN